MTNRAAAATHRQLDLAQAEALARDDGELVEHSGALMPPARRKGDLKSMSGRGQGKVLLLQLSERTSGSGTPYLAGWFGKAKLVGFKAREPDKYGNPQWDIYASEPEAKGGQDGGAQR